ncbi:MAG: alpha-glucosidase, partial [Acetobacteraceae bacterium]|nr:alpha-glucosidase [Acetobacteraceae bacterium]
MGHVGSDGGAEWWRGAVLYQVYPRSFQDSDGDGIGDLPGLIDRLDHIAGLGVDAIWVCPFYPSPQRDFGYDISEHCA